jgi:prepilin-type processing-associated H-X9-DG protein
VYGAKMAVGGVELDPAVDIEERLRTVCGHLNVLNAQLVELAAEALATGAWQGMGVKSLAHWLTWQAGISAGHAREVVRLAEARESHPQVMATFATGALSQDQAAIATKAPAHLDMWFAEVATVATVAQLRVMARAARPAPKPAPTDEPVEVVAGWFDDDGRYRLQAELDSDHGRIVDAALTEARDALFHDGRANVSWADALVEIGHRSLDGAPNGRRERFRVNWFIDPTDPIPARWSDGLAVPDWLRDQVLCDGTVTPTFTENALPVSVGRTQYQVPDRTRRLVLARDRKCRVPWCTQTRWLQVHRIIHDQHHGPTDTWNLAGLCPADHRLHHQGELGITGNADDPDGLTFTDAAGNVIDPATRPCKPIGSPPGGPVRPYEHPLGERLQRWAILFPDPPPDHRPQPA